MPLVIFRPNSAVLCFLHHRRMWFFNYQDTNFMLKRNFKIVLDTVQSLKITLLSTVALNAPPHLFNSVNIRQFDCSLFLVKSMMNSVNSRWVTDLSLLLRVVTVVVNLVQLFSQTGNIEPRYSLRIWSWCIFKSPLSFISFDLKQWLSLTCRFEFWYGSIFTFWEKNWAKFTTVITTLRRRERSVTHLELTEFIMDLTRKS